MLVFRFILSGALIIGLIVIGLFYRWGQFQILAIGIPILTLLLFIIGDCKNDSFNFTWVTRVMFRFSVFMTVFFVVLNILEFFSLEIGWELYSTGFFMGISWILTVITFLYCRFQLRNKRND